MMAHSGNPNPHPAGFTAVSLHHAVIHVCISIWSDEQLPSRMHCMSHSATVVAYLPSEGIATEANNTENMH